MKNFKRVISAVIALALSASTLVAVSASKFTDVDNTNYAEAIEVLTALDIVHGYEDGSFKPAGDITRAEAATMIVGALNMTKEAQAAAGSSKFTDVNEKASWAAGYVNVGVAQGFINGMDDTTFAPQENVTYAQMCVMLTLITGYGDYAAAYGGYPTGYTTMAATAGINKGVALTADAKLQRGQVAQMIYNALTAPLLGVKSYNTTGNDYAMQDGSSLAFKTLLADKFEGYEADIKVTAVPKSDTSLNKGEINIELTKDAYLDKVMKDDKAKAPATGVTAYNFGKVYDEAGADDMLNISGKAILKLDANDKWHLVYFKASDLNKVTVKAEDYVSAADDGKNAGTDHKITFGSKSYNLNKDSNGVNDGKIYVNGKVYQIGTTDAAVNETNVSTVLGLAQGDVTLIDDNDIAGYDKIMVTVYDIAKVDAVLTSNSTTTLQITPKAGLSTTLTTIKLTDDAIADGTVDLKVKDAKGEDVALSSIKKGDIIGYAIAPATGSTLTDPAVIDIRVTDEKISGIVNRIDDAEHTYTVGDTAYKIVGTWANNLLDIGTSYSLYLDPFGRLYDYVEVEAVADKYAIAKEYIASDRELKIILPDGTTKSYEVSATNVTVDNTFARAYTVGSSALGTSCSFADFTTYLADNSVAIEDCVIKYTVKNSTGKISAITLLQCDGTTNNLTYRESTSKLGNYTIGATTDVVYATSRTAEDIAKYAVSSFKDKEQYNAGIFTDPQFGNTAIFVVLTRTGFTFNGDSRFAVVRKAAVASQTSDGDKCLSLNVLYAGEEKDILCNDNTAVRALNPGDAFFFTTDSDGFVEEVVPVYTASSSTSPVDVTVASSFNFGSSASNRYDQTTSPLKWSFGQAAFTTAGSVADYQLVYGIITNVTNKGVEFSVEGVQTASVSDPVAGQTSGKYIDLTTADNTKVFGLDSDAQTYRYAKGEYASNVWKSINLGAPTASPISGYETGRNTSLYKLDRSATDDGEDHLTYAVALIQNGDIVEIYTITQQ